MNTSNLSGIQPFDSDHTLHGVIIAILRVALYLECHDVMTLSNLITTTATSIRSLGI